ncbi:hypothetical protein SAMN05216241_101114 [Limimonas halophila]|uniref:Phospholipid-binding protein, PBP family n=1 Tax=Limimonas halophila TaxID=1082479 RepID=A0A1G7L4J9_9PROT|nr:YbhB/YbcL family Raf kinase inhibitor-like protein [Limimonas halophila]SDF44393.1 hypothetical protein SAMN05216241_101114 [Limimonas halophila]
MAFELTTTAFGEGDRIPVRHTCDGDDLSPALKWADPPAGTQSFLLIVADPDAPGGVFHHWGVYEIPGTWRQLTEGYTANTRQAGFREAMNDFGNEGFNGPCPPPGHGTHHYHFRLYALSLATLNVPDRPSCPQLMDAARPNVLDVAEVMGLYTR